MYGTNLSYARLKTYLPFLTSRGLLAHNSDRYVTTEEGHRFLEAFSHLNDMLEGRARRAFLEILSESYGKAEIAHMGVNSQVGKRARANPVKKAAIVIFISLAHEAEKKTSEELKTEIQKALEEGLARIPWVAVEKVIVLEE
jgi:hypothetical protein